MSSDTALPGLFAQLLGAVKQPTGRGEFTLEYQPLVGYVGLLDDYISFAHLRATADALDSGTVVLVGRANTDVSGLVSHPRIRWLGQRPYETIPAYMQAFSCCLVPFARNRLTDGVNPIKLLVFAAVINGVAAGPFLALLMLISSDRKIMGKYTNGKLAQTFGWITTALMSAAAIILFVFGHGGGLY